MEPSVWFGMLTTIFCWVAPVQYKASVPLVQSALKKPLKIWEFAIAVVTVMVRVEAHPALSVTAPFVVMFPATVGTVQNPLKAMAKLLYQGLL